MDLKKIKKRALEIAPEIDGWDMDGDFLWATYPADGPMGKVIGIDMKHGNIALAVDDADFTMTSADLSDAAGVTKGRIRQLAPDMEKEGIAIKDRHGRWAFKAGAVDWIKNNRKKEHDEMILFAIFKNGKEYVFHPANNIATLGFRACLEKFGQPSEHFNRHDWSVPGKWRGKPLRAAKITYSDRTATGLATSAKAE